MLWQEKNGSSPVQFCFRLGQFTSRTIWAGNSKSSWEWGVSFDSLTNYIDKLVVLVWYLWACKCRIFVLSIERFVPLFFFLKGEAVLEKSSELIHSGDVIKTSNGSSQDRVMFLFDHQLVYCKKVRTNDSSRPRETLASKKYRGGKKMILARHAELWEWGYNFPYIHASCSHHFFSGIVWLARQASHEKRDCSESSRPPILKINF